jgi:glucosamine--fructose-6-phosphate aminotransferase (isomerizing)
VNADCTDVHIRAICEYLRICGEFMCGIVGYLGNKQAAPILLEGLARMEYRGYDSAGLVVVSKAGSILAKSKGRVIKLVGKLDGQEPAGFLGIAHTRWATHGVPSDANAHPHSDCKGEIFVVHNGIIENYQSIKDRLIKDGHKFLSETDTEVLAHLIESLYTGDITLAVQQALKQIIGAYGLAVVSSREPEVLVAAKVGSPLAIGVADGEFIVASDVTAILPVTQNVIYLEDGDLAIIKNSKLTITDLDNKTKNNHTQKIEWSMESAQKEGFEHFMLKEIFQQPEAIKNSIRGRLLISEGDVKLGGLAEVREKLRGINRLVVLGMGTARIAGLVGEYMLEEYASLPVEVEFASEFSYKKSPFDKHTAVLAVSQSGETADTLIALKEAKRKGILTLGIVNVTGSSIARETSAGVYNHIGPEIAVASTKAFVSQVTIFALLTVFMGRMRNMSQVTGERILTELENLPALVDKILDTAESIKQVAEKYKHYDHFLYLGRKYNFPIALEGALKLKEIAYVHAEGYNGGEMKHGPIALIDERFPTFILAPSDSVYEKNISHIKEIKAREGRVIAVATEGNEEIRELVDDVIYIPKTLEMLTPILTTVPLQLFAYYVSVAKGLDVDKPRNLAKSVTVE